MTAGDIFCAQSKAWLHVICYGLSKISIIRKGRNSISLDFLWALSSLFQTNDSRHWFEVKRVGGSWYDFGRARNYDSSTTKRDDALGALSRLIYNYEYSIDTSQ